MTDLFTEWQQKGATLSNATACKEYGLTRNEIIDAIQSGDLDSREMSVHGNRWYRLLRREVEKLVRVKHGGLHLQTELANTALGHINLELKHLRRKIIDLEKRKAEIENKQGVN